MQFSEPIYVLKRKARLQARETGIPLHRALDNIALEEGFRSWSHLAASKGGKPQRDILAQLKSGDLCLLGARPGQGKTLLGLELALRAAELGRAGYFFTLDYHERDVADHIALMRKTGDTGQRPLTIDTSDDVSADYIVNRLAGETAPALIVVDYLQLLDQKRTNPALTDQIAALRDFVVTTGAICIVISQIDRAFDLAGKPMPDMSDVRLPNPLDLSVFNTSIFLHQGKIRFDQTRDGRAAP